MSLPLKIEQDNDSHSLNLHGLIGFLAVVVLLICLTVWAAKSEISGAVISHGSFVVDGFPKLVQHREGGIVDEILVQDRDFVAVGQVLAVLDDTDLAAGLAVLEGQLAGKIVREARLLAELDGLSDFTAPDSLVGLVNSGTDTQLATERRVLRTNASVRQSQSAQLGEQINQIEQQIQGLEFQLNAVKQRRTIVEADLISLTGLLEDGLVEASRVSELTKEQAVVEGEVGSLIAAIAQARTTILERELQTTQLSDEFLNSRLTDLQTVQGELGELWEQRKATIDKLQRTRIKAPQSGIIHESVLHTIGGVVPPGQTLMSIVPQGDNLVVEVRISPLDVDKVSVGQTAKLVLSSFDQRSTPELRATISNISPDLSRDQTSGSTYYTARIQIDKSEFQRLPTTLKIVPGMPVDVYLETENRSVLSYLIGPFVEQFRRAMRES